MGLSQDSKLGDILANEKGKEVLEKHAPGITKNPQLAMAKNFTLKAIMPMSQGKLTPDKLKAIDEDLKKI